ncbi:hypothetical protein MHU86_23509 [Fragilaria crotonensis]|nr:hypothetical protein MHU86_23509 [Fragilaria crotonensis]
MPPVVTNILESSPATRTRSKQGQGGRVRLDRNGEPETPTARTKRKLKEEKRKAAKRAKLLETVQQTEPVETVELEKPGKKRVVGSGGKAKRKKTNRAKAKRAPPPPRNNPGSERKDSDHDDSSYKSTDGDRDDDTEAGGKVPRTPDAMHDSPDDDESSGDDEDSRRRSNSLKRQQQNRKESSRRAQEGAADPPSEDDGTSKASKPPRRATNDYRPRELQFNAELEVPTVEKNVAQRITIFVKNNLFRRIKFVTSQASFTKAFQKGVEPKTKYLRTVRSQIARDAIKDFKSAGRVLHIRGILQAQEIYVRKGKRAFFWFFNNFLECVCGANVLRNAKQHSSFRRRERAMDQNCECERRSLRFVANRQLLGEVESRSGGGGRRHWTKNRKQQHNNRSRNRQRAGNTKESKKNGGKVYQKSGTMQVQWVESDGISQFNALRKVVEEDRACPEAEQMEKELMRFCRASAGKKNAGDNQDDELDAGGAAPNNTLERAEAMVPVEADWDSDDD